MLADRLPPTIDQLSPPELHRAHTSQPPQPTPRHSPP